MQSSLHCPCCGFVIPQNGQRYKNNKNGTVWQVTRVYLEKHKYIEFDDVMFVDMENLNSGDVIKMDSQLLCRYFVQIA